MAGNFVILYNGREGSSAIINTLSGQNGIYVPLFEDLDRYQFLKRFKARDIPATLKDIFSTGAYPNKSKDSTNLQYVEDKTPVETIGFKWRIYGDTVKIGQIFTDNNVTVYLLSRREFLDLTCSSYIHTFGNAIQSSIEIAEHPQFNTKSLSREELEDHFSKLSAQSFRLVSRWFLKSARQLTRVKSHQQRLLKQLAAQGVKVRVIYYEDFDKNPEVFIKGFMSNLGLQKNAPFNTHCDIIKVHKQPISERILGLEKLTTGWLGAPYRLFEWRYNRKLQNIERLSKSTLE